MHVLFFRAFHSVFRVRQNSKFKIWNSELTWKILLLLLFLLLLWPGLHIIMSLNFCKELVGLFDVIFKLRMKQTPNILSYIKWTFNIWPIITRETILLPWNHIEVSLQIVLQNNNFTLQFFSFLHWSGDHRRHQSERIYSILKIFGKFVDVFSVRFDIGIKDIGFFPKTVTDNFSLLKIDISWLFYWLKFL